jgi:hypothetical protein
MTYINFQHLRKSGLGNLPRASAPLTDADITKFYEMGLLGNGNPDSLLRSLHRNNMTFFGMRANLEHRNLCWGDVVLEVDPDSGLRYLELRTERVTKTRQGENPRNKRQVNPKAFEIPGSDRCPVQCYMSYRDRRPQDFSKPEDPFYIATNHTGGVWFKRQPVGIHKIAKFVPSMVAAAGLKDGRILTNTSYRKQLAVRLNEGGVPKDVGRHVTGHKQASSLDNYAALSTKQQRALSTIVGGDEASTSYTDCLAVTEAPRMLLSSSRNIMASSGSSRNIIASSVTAASNNTSPSAASSLFSGATIQGGTWNIHIHNSSSSASPLKRKRNYVLYSSDED